MNTLKNDEEVAATIGTLKTHTSIHTDSVIKNSFVRTNSERKTLVKNVGAYSSPEIFISSHRDDNTC